MSNPTASINFSVPSALGTIDLYVTGVNKCQTDRQRLKRQAGRSVRDEHAPVRSRYRQRIIEVQEIGCVESEGLKRALTNLDERSRGVISLGWLAEDQEETPQMLADKYGVSAERIRQIEVKAMKPMRKGIEN